MTFVYILFDILIVFIYICCGFNLLCKYNHQNQILALIQPYISVIRKLLPMKIRMIFNQN